MDIERLKKAKKEKKLSYDDLAEINGYSRSTITNIFCGYIEFPRHETIKKIEEALDLSPAPLSFTDKEKALGVVATTKETLSSDEIELLDAYRAIKDEKGERAAHAIKTMVETFLDEKK